MITYNRLNNILGIVDADRKHTFPQRVYFLLDETKYKQDKYVNNIFYE